MRALSTRTELARWLPGLRSQTLIGTWLPKQTEFSLLSQRVLGQQRYGSLAIGRGVLPHEHGVLHEHAATQRLHARIWWAASDSTCVGEVFPLGRLLGSYLASVTGDEAG
jgi:hypothetical protein